MSDRAFLSFPRWLALVMVTVTLVAASATHAPVAPAQAADRFWTKNARFYTSPWFEGRHRIMIPFGCTRAPYYSPDPRCERQRGFHHGIDVAMRCGTKIFSNVQGRVANPRSAGAPGSAYGAKAFRIRAHGRDYVFGHVRRALVDPGDRIGRGDLIARAGALGAPDGCHLHFEVRPQRTTYTSALRPWDFLHLRLHPRSQD